MKRNEVGSNKQEGGGGEREREKRGGKRGSGVMCGGKRGGECGISEALWN